VKGIFFFCPKWYQEACLGVSRWTEKSKNVVSITFDSFLKKVLFTNISAASIAVKILQRLNKITI
jgi:hypothetical protein